MTARAQKKRGINVRQMRLLRFAIRSLGLEDNYYDILLRCAGVSSSKQLDIGGFRAVMAYLERQGFKAHSSKLKAQSKYKGYLDEWAKLGHRPGMATAAQLARIEADWDSLEWFWNKNGEGKRSAALRGFLKNRFGRSDLRMLTFADAHKAIEALKAIVRRHEAAKKQ